MEVYFLKVSILIGVFYLGHKLAGFHTRHIWSRFYLIFGIVSSFLLPFIEIPVYEYVTAEPILSEIVMQSDAIVTQQAETNSLGFWDYLAAFYLVGVLLYLLHLMLQFVSLRRLIRKSHSQVIHSFKCLLSEQITSPFSFGNLMFLHPRMLSEDSLTTIVNHEAIHIRQHHFIDTLLAELATILLWFNPLIWLYKKEIKQNLEYLADSNATRSTSKKEYQELLLKQVIKQNNYGFITPFYTSQIKKRIVMLQQTPTPRKHLIRYAVLIPMLSLFAYGFAFKTVVISTSNTFFQNPSEFLEDNVLKFNVNKTTTDQQLDEIKTKLKNEGIDVTIDELRRNDNGHISRLAMHLESKVSTINFDKDGSDGIDDFTISYDKKDNGLTVGDARKDLSQTIPLPSRQKTTSKNSEKSAPSVSYTSNYNSNTYSKSKNSSDQSVAGKAKAYAHTTSNSTTTTIESDTIRILNGARVWVDDKGSTTIISSVDHNNLSYVSGESQPMFIINGEVVKKSDLDQTDPDDIEHVYVYKGAPAISKYGSEAKNGVVVIHTDGYDSDSSIVTNSGHDPKIYVSTAGSHGLKLITGDTTDEELRAMKRAFSEEGLDFDYSKVKRNSSGKITSIKLELSNDDNNLSTSHSESGGIGQIRIGQQGRKLIVR